MKVSTKVNPEEMLGDGITKADLAPFQLPQRQEFLAAGIRGIHLGDYVFWDGERQVEFIKNEYGWQEDEIQGTYKRYKSVECRMPGMHDYLKFLKRGVRTGDRSRQPGRSGRDPHPRGRVRDREEIRHGASGGDGLLPRNHRPDRRRGDADDRRATYR